MLLKRRVCVNFSAKNGDMFTSSSVLSSCFRSELLCFLRIVIRKDELIVATILLCLVYEYIYMFWQSSNDFEFFFIIIICKGRAYIRKVVVSEGNIVH